MTPTDDEIMTDEEYVTPDETQRRRESTSRWDNTPGDIVITQRGGQAVIIQL